MGYKVNSERAVQFRKWATQILQEFTIKGFAMDAQRFIHQSLGPISTPFSNFESRFINKLKGSILNSNHSPVLNQGDALLHIGFDEKNVN